MRHNAECVEVESKVNINYNEDQIAKVELKNEDVSLLFHRESQRSGVGSRRVLPFIDSEGASQHILASKYSFRPESG